MVSDKATLFNEENLRKAFNMLDVDGDGRIDQREMQLALLNGRTAFDQK